MAPIDTARTVGRFGGKYLGKIAGFFFLFIFIIIPILYAITISIQESDIGAGLSYLAPKLITPTLNLNEQSLLAIEQGGTYIKTGNFFGDVWNFIKYNWVLLGALYIIYRWIKVLFKVMPSTPYSNNKSAVMTNIALAVTIFIVIQMLFLGYMAADDPEIGYWDAVNTPFKAVYNFLRAFPYFISEATYIIDWNLSNNTINLTDNENLSNIINVNLSNETILNTSQGSLIIY